VEQNIMFVPASDAARAKNVQAIIDHMRDRPMMYLGGSGDHDFPTIEAFLHGFAIAFTALGIDLPFQDSVKKVAEERGWQHTSQPYHRQMYEKGMDEHAIIHEYLTIYSVAWAHITQFETIASDQS